MVVHLLQRDENQAYKNMQWHDNIDDFFEDHGTV